MASVFIIDDDEIFKLGLTAALKTDDRIDLIGEAENPEAAISQLMEMKPDVIVVSSHNGGDNIQAIRKLSPNAKILAVDSDPDVSIAIAAGANAYIFKTTRIALFLQAITVVADGAAWFDPKISSEVLHKFSALLSECRNNAPSLQACSLSPREIDVLSLVCHGASNSQIGAQLCISGETVKTHVRNIMEKLHATSRTEAAVKAVYLGFPHIEDIGQDGRPQ